MSETPITRQDMWVIDWPLINIFTGNRLQSAVGQIPWAISDA